MKKKWEPKDWAAVFRNKNQEISLKKFENSTAAISFVFTKTAVIEIFDNYERVMLCYIFTSDRKINVEETVITTALPTTKVLAEKTETS